MEEDIERVMECRELPVEEKGWETNYLPGASDASKGLPRSNTRSNDSNQCHSQFQKSNYERLRDRHRARRQGNCGGLYV